MAAAGVAVVVLFVLFHRIHALSIEYEAGPVNLTDRVKLWYKTTNDSFAFALSVKFPQKRVRNAFWVGIGLAEAQSVGMRGADLFTAHFPKGLGDCKSTQDRHAPFIGYPRGTDGDFVARKDTNGKDVWTPRKCTRYSNGTVLLEVVRSRKITSRNIMEDTWVAPGVNHFLHAYGEGRFRYHEIANRGSTPVVLYSRDAMNTTPPVLTPTPMPDDRTGQFAFYSGKYNVTGSNLTCFTATVKAPNGSMVVAITPKVKSKAVVRMVIYGCHDTRFFSDPNKVMEKCSRAQYNSGARKDAKCTTMFYSWAPNVGPLVFPPEAGITLNNGNQRLIMEVSFASYLGPYEAKDAGVVFHYTTKPREHEVGSLLLGAATYSWAGIRVQNVSSDCKKECTSYWDRPINLFAMHMHMGRYGNLIQAQYINSTISDKDEATSYIARVPYWAPHLEQLHTFDKPKTINPGDEITISCDVVANPKRDIIYGRNAEFEQCEVYAHYWPAQYRNSPDDGGLYFCSSEADVHGRSATLCGAGWRKDRLLVTKNDSVCFPASAKVQLRGGRSITMANVRVGDEVLVSAGVYSPVYMFSHQLSDAVHWFVVLGFDQSSENFVATEGHLLYVNGVLSRAGTIRPGDLVEDAHGNALRVNSVSREPRVGLFNPQTVHGDIIVDGVRASTYTESVDYSLAHALLAPFRSVFQMSSLDIVTSFVCGSGREALLGVRDSVLGLR